MAQKINPTSFRIGVTKDWKSQWFPKKFDFAKLLEEDVLIRKITEKRIKNAGIDSIEIERMGNKYKIVVKAARPGLIIGRGGKGIEELIKALEVALGKLRQAKDAKNKISLSLNIEELKRSDISANIIAQNIAWDLEKRMPFRRTIKKYLEQVTQNREVKGAKIKVAGRLDGAEIARTEQLAKGRLPLQTLRADIDYGEVTAFTTFGTVGVKVWIYKGEIFKK
ncbi:30S ribosomal protein S3 [Candidatus Wolfebacteria bacterium CG_4_10_14_0_8_um_filter_37_11]|uniref:Small ribosomal subunit protein uS3 n=2 Tax=Candidatus Wolfeibacteriota TaxID=1752735 RepID=A0A2M7Q7D7_9BACT|nr:MAG: 30S ribosomal protein S3 [Candidatus Wolfebacteria bacterium CG_4_10_14_0_8_um_filter_37_11]PJA41868.1 MAG: 30S ribosomal protein S3 [Candidatus Wolfebacteria bacterium CG_4_9_14_3_um_filter_37_9]